MPSKREAHRRHAEHYVNILHSSNELYRQGGEFVSQALTQFNNDWAQFQQGQQWASNSLLYDKNAAVLCNRYANDGIDLLQLRNQMSEKIVWLEAGVVAARQLERKLDEGTHIGNLGNIYDHLGQYAKSIEYYEQALAISREIKDRWNEGVWLGNLGNIYQAVAQYDRALDYYHQAGAIAHEVDNEIDEVTQLENIGTVLFKLGRYDQSIEYHERVLAILERYDHKASIASTLGNLGNTYAHKGQFLRAKEYFQRAIAIFRSLGDKRSEGIWLANLGGFYLDAGQYAEALDCFQKALTIAQESNNRASEANILGDLGTLYLSKEDFDQASTFFERALLLCQELGDRLGEATVLANLGSLQLRLGQFDQAIFYSEKALSIHHEIGNLRGEGATLGDLGTSYAQLGNYDKAIDLLQQAIVIHREIGNPRGEGTSIVNLGTTYFKQGRHKHAIDHIQLARIVLKPLGMGSLVEQTDRILSVIVADRGQSHETVVLSVSYPLAISPNQMHSLDGYIFKEFVSPPISGRAREETTSHGGLLNRFTKLAHRSKQCSMQITLIPDVPALAFEPDHRTLQFAENYHLAQFRFQLTANPANRLIRGFVVFTADGVIVAQIPVQIRIQMSVITFESIHALRLPDAQVFTSYSPQDVHVTKRIEHVAELLSLDFFGNVRISRDNGGWNESVRKLIEKADIFQLFWSTKASISSVVDKEWRYALDLVKTGRKPDNFIRPVYWAEDVPRLPDELQTMRFIYLSELSDRT